jgi:hypothetical protein
LTDYSKVLRLQPSNTSARLARASLYAASGARDSAVADYAAVLTGFTDQKDSVLAAARLRQLGVTSAPAQVVNRVYVQYMDTTDLAVVRRIVESLKAVGWRVMGPERRSEPTRGDVRFFYREDQRRASQLLSDAELAAAKQGIQINLTRIYLAKRNAPHGQLEVWLPPLTTGQQAGY